MNNRCFYLGDPRAAEPLLASLQAEARKAVAAITRCIQCGNLKKDKL